MGIDVLYAQTARLYAFSFLDLIKKPKSFSL